MQEAEDAYLQYSSENSQYCTFSSNILSDVDTERNPRCITFTPKYI